MAFTFRGGVHPSGHKELTENKATAPFFDVPKVYIPLSSHIGKPAIPVVRGGDYVRKGQLIAAAAEGISANLFSSVSGMVKGIVMRPLVSGKSGEHIEIENDFKEEDVTLPVLTDPDAEEIIQRIKDAGIVGMGGAAFPSHIKLRPPKEGATDILLINGAECEPYITCDYRVMTERAEDFVEGVRLLKKGCGAKKALILIESNKIEAIKKLAALNIPIIKKRKSIEDLKDIGIIQLKTKYPQGAEKQLIYAATGRKVPEGKLPSAVGATVVNAQTALAVYDAVKRGKPLYERVMTVSGDAVENPCNLLVRTGTPFKDIIERVGLKGDYEMMICGGPMMGHCCYSQEVCVTKGTGALLLLTDNSINIDRPSACIGCGRCVKVCPMRLMPLMIDSYAIKGDFALAEKYGAGCCIECGSCSYVCPANRPLVQSIRVAKIKIREGGAKR